MAGQRLDVLVHGIDEVAGEGEERLFDFVRRRDPITGAHDHGRGIEVIERELADLARHGVQETASFAGVAGQEDPACLTDGGEYRLA